MLTGLPPFYHQDRYQMFKNIIEVKENKNGRKKTLETCGNKIIHVHGSECYN